MPKFLEDKLKREYGENSAIPYKVMNDIGAMKGNKETEKGREMEKKHEEDTMKKPSSTAEPMRGMRIEIHRGPGMKVTGHTVHHDMMPKKAANSPGGAFMEETNHSFPFDAHGESSSHGNMLDHIADHLGMGGEPKGEGAEGE
jgi:hypothetical protein